MTPLAQYCDLTARYTILRRELREIFAHDCTSGKHTLEFRSALSAYSRHMTISTCSRDIIKGQTKEMHGKMTTVDIEA